MEHELRKLGTSHALTPRPIGINYLRSEGSSEEELRYRNRPAKPLGQATAVTL
jgi:hypothetical protein